MWARTIVWIIKDVGVPIAALIVLTAVLLGWVDSPLMRLTSIDTHVRAQTDTLIRHTDSTNAFQVTLAERDRKGRCMTAVSAISTKAETISWAALSTDPCAVLEVLQQDAGKRR